MPLNRMVKLHSILLLVMVILVLSKFWLELTLIFISKIRYVISVFCDILLASSILFDYAMLGWFFYYLSTQDGCSALYYATLKNHIAVVHVLLKQHAQTNISNMVCSPLLEPCHVGLFLSHTEFSAWSTASDNVSSVITVSCKFALARSWPVYTVWKKDGSFSSTGWIQADRILFILHFSN